MKVISLLFLTKPSRDARFAMRMRAARQVEEKWATRGNP
jgi:hypothetical protein